MPWPVAYIALVRASPNVERKILERHGVTMNEVWEAVVLTQVLRSAWDFDQQRGWRLLVVGETYESRRLNVVLYPAQFEEGSWNLGTAMPAE